jgi:hypothetical protein
MSLKTRRVFVGFALSLISGVASADDAPPVSPPVYIPPQMAGMASVEQVVNAAINRAYNLGLNTGIQLQTKMAEMAKETESVKKELDEVKKKCGSPCADSTAAPSPPK